LLKILDPDNLVSPRHLITDPERISVFALLENVRIVIIEIDTSAAF